MLVLNLVMAKQDLMSDISFLLTMFWWIVNTLMGVQCTPATLLVLQPLVSRLLEHSLRLALTIFTVMII